MMSLRTTVTTAALLAAATPLVAQDPGRVYTTRPRGDVRVYTTTPDRVMESRRGVIGVGVDLRPSANDSTGATVTTVTPGSAAAGAGIVSGDIITKFNGTPLVVRGSRVTSDDGDEPQSQPGLKLVDLASRMSPGDTVAVEWKHERQRKTAQLVTQPAATMVYSDNMEMPDVRFFGGERPGTFRLDLVGPDGPGTVELQKRLDALRRPLELAAPSMNGTMWMRMGGPLGGIQFAPLNADLGKYFGTTEGILVLETPDTDSHVDLKGGDVILAIGDRKPANVEHLFRILGSYQDSETVNFDVMRDHHRVTVTAKAEDLQGAGRRWKVLQRDMDMAPAMDAPREERAPLPARVPGHPAPARRPGV